LDAHRLHLLKVADAYNTGRGAGIDIRPVTPKTLSVKDLEFVDNMHVSMVSDHGRKSRMQVVRNVQTKGEWRAEVASNIMDPVLYIKTQLSSFDPFLKASAYSLGRGLDAHGKDRVVVSTAWLNDYEYDFFRELQGDILKERPQLNPNKLNDLRELNELVEVKIVEEEISLIDRMVEKIKLISENVEIHYRDQTGLFHPQYAENMMKRLRNSGDQMRAIMEKYTGK
jgi:hypothetical protein